MKAIITYYEQEEEEIECESVGFGDVMAVFFGVEIPIAARNMSDIASIDFEDDGDVMDIHFEPDEREVH